MDPLEHVTRADLVILTAAGLVAASVAAHLVPGPLGFLQASSARMGGADRALVAPCDRGAPACQDTSASH